MEKQFQTWRDILGELNGVERKRLVDALGIQNKTLERWIRGETALPQLDRLRNLLAALPIRIRKRFIDSIRQDPRFSKHLAELPLEEETYDIPSVIYARILEANVKTPKDLRFSSLCQLILLESVGQLDIDRVGISVSILTCTPPHAGRGLLQQRAKLCRGAYPEREGCCGLFTGAQHAIRFLQSTNAGVACALREPDRHRHRGGRVVSTGADRVESNDIDRAAAGATTLFL